jgi:hypothetical protein
MHTLEKISHIVFVAVALLLAGLGLWRVIGADEKPVVEARETQREVERSVLAGLGVAQTPTLLITVSSTCRFCTASMGFYRRVSTAARSAGARVMFSSREPVDVIRRYVSEHGLATADVIALPIALDVPSTPSLMWVAPGQAKVPEWIGQLSARQEEAVLAVVTNRK